MKHSPLSVISEEPWYKEGLHFQCTQCGQCCTGAPGYTWVSPQEIKEIASFLQISVEIFCQRYVRQVGDRLALLENQVNYDCVFLKDKKCQIYSARPKQCRTFPWWPRNLKSKKDWEEAARFCEGINPQARVVSCTTIREQLAFETDETE